MKVRPPILVGVSQTLCCLNPTCLLSGVCILLSIVKGCVDNKLSTQMI